MSRRSKSPFNLIFTASLLLTLLALPTFAQIATPRLPGTASRLPAIDRVSDQQPITLELVPQYAAVAPGQTFYLALVIELAPDWHIYAHENPGYGLPTEITPLADPCFTFGSPLYAPGYLHQYPDDTVEQLYASGPVAYLPVSINSAALPDPLPASVTIQIDIDGQLCQDNGVCQIWSPTIQAVVPLAAEPSTELNQPEVFAQLPSIIAAAQADQAAPADTSAISSSDWLTPIGLAILVGLVMNLMPCVLPIIPIVVMTLVNSCAPPADQPASAKPRKTIFVGLAFAAGIMLVFAGLAILMSVFKLVWGQQFQSNTFKFILLMIVFVLSLSMFGLFEIVLPARLANISVKRKGYLGAFGMGMLATLLATPCGAPLLTPVLVWSLAKPLFVTIIVFLVIGLGMALPYVILTASPALINRIPKAGNWMIILKYAIGFAMLAFAAYLLLLFPADWHADLLYFCIIIAFCVWLAFKAVTPVTAPARRIIARLAALVIIIVASIFLFSAPPASHVPTHDLSQLDILLQERPVVVKFTANWCKNCSVIDRTIYQTQTFADALADVNGALIIVDLSNQDPQLVAYLHQLSGQVLPFAAVFSPNDPDNPILLRDFYSMDDLLEALQIVHQSSTPSP
ncbi:MAG: thioredoxin family protein [Sedimentisphaerales bacterium]|nr:thioredoxin family protein [Sedimentisphaerales bacterium]